MSILFKKILNNKQIDSTVTTVKKNRDWIYLIVFLLLLGGIYFIQQSKNQIVEHNLKIQRDLLLEVDSLEFVNDTLLATNQLFHATNLDLEAENLKIREQRQKVRTITKINTIYQIDSTTAAYAIRLKHEVDSLSVNLGLAEYIVDALDEENKKLRDSLSSDPIYISQFEDEWLRIDMFAASYATKFNISKFKSSTYVAHSEQKRFLKPTIYTVTARELNPYTTDQAVTSYTIKPKVRRWGIGPNFSASLDANGKFRPTAGIGLQWNIIQF